MKPRILKASGHPYRFVFASAAAAACVLFLASRMLAQTVYVPSGSGGIGSSANSNVGIGTSTPLDTLDVNGSINFGPMDGAKVAVGTGNTFTPSGGTPTAYYGMTFGGFITNSLSLSGYNGIALYTGNGGERMRVDSGGNVGIGTSSPSEKVEVVGNIASSGDMIPGGNGVLRGVFPVEMYEGASVVNTTSWTNVTRMTYTPVANTFDGVPVLSGATRKYYLVIRKADDQPGGTGSYWRFRLPWASNAIGHGFTLVSDWGSSAEGSTRWIEIPPDYSGGLTGTGLYWVLDAKMANSGQTMCVFSLSLAAVDVRGGTNASYSAGGSGTAGASKLLSMAGNLYEENGNVGIGTFSPSHKLAVNGAIRAKEVIVDTGWSDYVFENSYKLKALSEVEAYVKAEKHLPGMPSAEEVAQHGVSVGEVQSKLLAKVEELTLHAIAQEKRIERQEAEIRELREQVAKTR